MLFKTQLFPNIDTTPLDLSRDRQSGSASTLSLDCQSPTPPSQSILRSASYYNELPCIPSAFTEGSRAKPHHHAGASRSKADGAQGLSPGLPSAAHDNCAESKTDSC